MCHSRQLLLLVLAPHGEQCLVELRTQRMLHLLQPELVLLKQEHVQMEVCPEVIQQLVVLLVVPGHLGVLLQVDTQTPPIHHRQSHILVHVLPKQELVQAVQCQGHIHIPHVL